ncbi:MAG: DUF4394 domain-containing protein, partial [Candidatus Eisenbacteria bacterium]
MRRSFSAVFAVLTLLLVTAPAARAAEEIWGVTVNNNLINFISSNPWAFSSRPITGLNAGDQVLGIDFRPALPLGRLYALGISGQLYRIDNPSSGVAVAVGPGGIVLSGTGFGLDFNPTVDRIRVISDADQNLRLHPDTGLLAVTDAAIAYAGTDANAGQNAMAGGAAYTNSVAGATSTMLFDIESNLDLLVTQAPPNNGTLNTVGPLGVNVSSVNGFDISGVSGVAFAAFDIGGAQSSLYVINLSTGAASLQGV